MFAPSFDATTTSAADLDAMIASVPASERAYAVRAADADARLTQWEAEMEAWEWPEEHDEISAYQGFLLPDDDERAVKRRKLTGYGLSPDDDDFWGCVPASLAQHYGRRIDAIQTDMDGLDLDNLKAFVLNSHSSQFDGSTYRPLSDSTALITGVILGFLPRVSRVVALLNTWEVRLSVLCKTSTYLKALDKAETCLKTGWEIVDELYACRTRELAAARDRKLFNEESLKSELAALLPKMAAELSERVSQCAQLIDNMLDGLEGRWERVPPDWIDRMDVLEADYGHWVVLAGRAELGAEWPLEALKRASLIEDNREGVASPNPELDEQEPVKETSEDKQRSINGISSPTPSSNSARNSVRLSKRLSRNVSIIDGFILSNTSTVVTAPPTPEMLSSSPEQLASPIQPSATPHLQRSTSPEAFATPPKEIATDISPDKTSQDRLFVPPTALGSHKSQPDSLAEATIASAVEVPTTASIIVSPGILEPKLSQNGETGNTGVAAKGAIDQDSTAFLRDAALKMLTEKSATASPTNEQPVEKALPVAASVLVAEQQTPMKMDHVTDPSASSEISALNRDSVITVLPGTPVLQAPPEHIEEEDRASEVVDKPRSKDIEKSSLSEVLSLSEPDKLKQLVHESPRLQAELGTVEIKNIEDPSPLLPPVSEQPSEHSPLQNLALPGPAAPTKMLSKSPLLLQNDDLFEDSPTVPVFHLDDEPSPLIINGNRFEHEPENNRRASDSSIMRILDAINPAALSATNLELVPGEPVIAHPLPAAIFEQVPTPEYLTPEITVQSPSLLDQLARPETRLEVLVREVLLGVDSPENISPVEKQARLESLVEEVLLRPDPLTQENVVRPESLLALLEPSVPLVEITQPDQKSGSKVPLDDEPTLPAPSIYDDLTPGSEIMVELGSEPLDGSKASYSLGPASSEFESQKAAAEHHETPEPAKDKAAPAESIENSNETAGPVAVKNDPNLPSLADVTITAKPGYGNERAAPSGPKSVKNSYSQPHPELQAEVITETTLQSPVTAVSSEREQPTPSQASDKPKSPPRLKLATQLSPVKNTIVVDQPHQIALANPISETGEATDQPNSPQQTVPEHTSQSTGALHSLARAYSPEKERPLSVATLQGPSTPIGNQGGKAGDRASILMSLEDARNSVELLKADALADPDSHVSARSTEHYLKYNAFASPRTPRQPSQGFDDDHELFDVAEDVSPLLAKFPTPPRSGQKENETAEQSARRGGFPESPTLPVSWSNDTIEDLEQAALDSKSVDEVLVERFYGGPILDHIHANAVDDSEILMEPVLPAPGPELVSSAVKDFATAPEGAAREAPEIPDSARNSIEVPVPEILDLDYILAASIELPDDVDDYEEAVLVPAGQAAPFTPLSKAAKDWQDSSPAGPRSPSPTPAEPKLNVRKRGKASANTDKRASTTSSSTVEEILDQKISSLLTRMPGKMRWSRERGASAKPAPQTSTRSSSRSSVTRPESRTSRPIRQTTESSVRVYRFHRQENEPPIRLFVRLVGENGERVMVRVGGGWSDLEAYLRAYALHHGRRSTSEGKIEVQDVSVSASGRCTPVSRPGSSMSFNSRRVDSSPLEMRTPAPTTPLNLRPGVTPPSRPGEGDSMLGLAGPRSRLVEMSPEDEAWVEGVKGQVRRASAQRRDELRSSVNSNGKNSPVSPTAAKDMDFGELGKVGGTRRLFMKKS